MTPPRLWRQLLTWSAAPVDRITLLGELDDEFERIAAEQDPRRARRWYRRQVLRSAGPLLRQRLTAARSRTGEGGLVADLRSGVRGVARRRALSITIVATLGLAIGASLAAIIVVDRVLLAPLPYPAPDQLVRLWNSGPAIPATVRAVSLQDVDDWRDQAPCLDALSAFTGVSATLTDRGDARRLEGMRIGPDFDRVLGIGPARGRLFVSDDFAPGAERVVILTDAFWRREFGGDASAVGATLQLDTVATRIVGILPPTTLPYPTAAHDYWVPLVPRAGARWESSRGTGWIEAVGRLRRDCNPVLAQEELTAIAGRLRATYPESNRDRVAVTVRPLADDLVESSRAALILVLVATGGLLLVALGNSLHLIIANAMQRRAEFAIRLTLGSGRGRLARQAIIEAGTLAAGASVTALAVAPLLLGSLSWLPETAVPRRGEIAVWPSGAFWAAALWVVTSLVLAWPLVRLVRRLPLAGNAGSLRSTGGRADRRARHWLIAAQAALSAMLVVGGALFVMTLQRLQAVDLGFVADDVYAVLPTPSRTAAPSGGAVVAFYRDSLERIMSAPGVIDAAATTSAPFVIGGWNFGLTPPGAPSSSPRHLVSVAVASPTYFDTLRIPVIEGRPLSEAEHVSGEPLTVISDTLRKLVFGAGPAVGQFIDYDRRQWRVVGVVADTRTRVQQAPEAKMYLPWAMAGPRPQAIVVRTTSAAAVAGIRDHIRGLDHQATITAPVALRESVDRTIAPQRFRARLLVGLAAIAALLAVFGAYSVTAFIVAAQRRECAIRQALGESAWVGRRRIVLGVLTPAAAGVLAGLGGAWYAQRFVESMLFGPPAGGSLLPIVGALLISLFAVGALAPATALSRLNPADVFRA